MAPYSGTTKRVGSDPGTYDVLYGVRLSSAHDLLTTGGDMIKLWSVVTGTAKQLPFEVNTAVDGEGGVGTLQCKRAWSQPMQKALFAPVGQVRFSTCMEYLGHVVLRCRLDVIFVEGFSSLHAVGAHELYLF